MNDELKNNDEVLLDESPASNGVPTAAVKPLPDYKDENYNKSNTPQVLDSLPTIKRQEKLSVDSNLNFIYKLKNGKQLKTSVKKPNLSISTELSDNSVRINETEDGQRYLLVNNMSLYQMIMEKTIRVILVDGAPLHTVTFDSLSQIGMTKSELDDYMGIITTFYLQE